MKKVLIITYFWPPSADTNVLRWLYFAKYLKQYQWEPVIVSLYSGNEEGTDSFYSDQIPDDLIVHSVPVKSSRKIFSFRKNYLHDITIRHACKKILAKCADTTFDSIVTVGPPHKIHFIGLQLKSRLGIPWLIDFPIGWFNDVNYTQLKAKKQIEKIKAKFEKNVLPQCDLVLTTSNKLSNYFIELGLDKVATLTNGYDYIPVIERTDKKFSIVHIGNLTANRNPENLWKAIASLKEQHESFRKDIHIELVGEVDKSVFKSMIKYNLGNNLLYREDLTVKESIERQFRAQINLFIINRTLDARGIIPNRLFEYLATFRPILGIGPVSGDAAEIVQQAKAGRVFNYREYRELKNQLLDWYDEFKEKELVIKPFGVKKYSRRSLTRQLVEILENISTQSIGGSE